MAENHASSDPSPALQQDMQADTTTTPTPTLMRLDEQIAWYDKNSSLNQRWFKTLKIAQILAGALIAFTSSLGAPAFVAGALGVLIVVLEGLQSLSQYQRNWISYRTICERLTHEKFVWLAKAGTYASAANPDVLLAERIEALISSETATWTATIRQKDQPAAYPDDSIPSYGLEVPPQAPPKKPKM
jgi:hypothetical protein